MTMGAILKLEGVRKSYTKAQRSVEALRGIDLSIQKGEFLAIVGPSGSGKTTLLNIVGCLDLPSSGSVLYDGRELGGMSETELSVYRKENISFIFQSYNLIPVLTVQENVELPMVIERRYSRSEMKSRAREIISAVGLGDMADRYPRELSGGQEQRVAIAQGAGEEPDCRPCGRAHGKPRLPNGGGDHVPHGNHEPRAPDHVHLFHP